LIGVRVLWKLVINLFLSVVYLLLERLSDHRGCNNKIKGLFRSRICFRLNFRYGLSFLECFVEIAYTNILFFLCLSLLILYLFQPRIFYFIDVLVLLSLSKVG
jgi:hypothetical protein